MRGGTPTSGLGIAGLIRRFARDTRGGTYILFAIAFFPLLGMIGSGIDMSRAYMAHTRLQQACDAAALAGRRAMTNGTVDATVTAEAQKFFRFNFPTGTAGTAGTAAFGTTGFAPSVTGAANSTVVVSANTVVPTSIMRLFGFVNIPIQVTCNARLDFVNTDIVLVLDTTGSMLCLPTEATCPSVTTERTGSKIMALRAAVLSMYDTLRPIQTQLEGVNLRLRYSVAPYSSSINVGRVLRGVDPSYVANDTWTYQSRIGVWRHVTSGVSASTCSERGGTLSGGNCTWDDNSPTGGTTNTFRGWSYGPRVLDISSYATGSSTPTTTVASTATTIPTRTDGSTATWAGCIEERQTSRMSSTASSIPSDAWDLNIDMIPTSDRATKWKPYWPEVEYMPVDINWPGQPEDYKPQVACPTETRRLQAWTRDALSTYLDTLRATGGTYHDNGMRWAVRLLSGAGVFSADNPSSFGGMPVSKYIIFMTDGAMDTGWDTLYATYGIEAWDARVTSGGYTSSGRTRAARQADQEARHLNRFNLLCTEAKRRGISIWVVAFAQALTPSLSACASNPNQASTSDDQDELEERFVQIGRNIGALRLTQ